MRSYNPGKMGLFERAKRKALPYLFALGGVLGCGNSDGLVNNAPVAVNDSAVILEDSVNNLIDVLGAPLSGANVYVRNGASVYKAMTDANGRALIPMDGTVTVTYEDYMPFVE